MKTKRFFAIVLAAILMCSSTVVSFASDNKNDEFVNTASIDAKGTLNTNTQNKNNIDLIYCDNVNEKNITALKEYIDNGSDVFVNTKDIEKYANMFDCSYAISDEDSKSEVLGCYIQTVGGEYSLTPVVVLMINDDSEHVEIPKEYLAKINSDIDSSELYKNLKYDYSDLNFSGKISDEELSHLQLTNNFGSSFKDTHLFQYFLKEGTSATGTNYIWSSNTKNGYQRLGSVNILGYAFKLKTESNGATYDNVYAIITASGLDDKFVNHYDSNMYTYANNPATIIHAPTLQGDINSTVTIGITTDIASDGSVVISPSATYSYNPRGQRINNQLGEKKMKTWRAAPGSPIKNESWQLQPYVTVRNGRGTSTSTIVGLSVSEFQVSGGVRTYTISNSCATSLSFTNHK